MSNFKIVNTTNLVQIVVTKKEVNLKKNNLFSKSIYQLYSCLVVICARLNFNLSFGKPFQLGESGTFKMCPT